MENKVKSYKEIFNLKYNQLKQDLEGLVSFVKDKKDLSKKSEGESKEESFSNSQSGDMEQLKLKNENLEFKLEKKNSLMQDLKIESKNILNELGNIIKNLTKSEEEK